MSLKGLFVLNLRKKLIGLFLVVSIMPIGIILFVNYTEARKNLEIGINKALLAIAKAKKDHIVQLIGLRKEQVLMIANNPDHHFHLKQINQGHPDMLKIKKELSTHQKQHIKSVKTFSEIFITDAKGEIVASTYDQDLGRDESDKDLFIHGKKGLYVKDFYFDLESEKEEIVYSIAAPMIDKMTNEFLGVVSIKIKTSIFTEILEDYTGLGATGESLLGKKFGNEVVFQNRLRHDADSALKRKVSIYSKDALPVIYSTNGKNGIIKTTDYRSVEVLSAYIHIPAGNWGLVSKIDTAEVFAPVYALRNRLIYFSIGIVAVVAFIAFLFGNKVTKPITALAIAFKKVSEGDLNIKVEEEKVKDEIYILASSFNLMTSKLMESYADMEYKVAKRTREMEKTNIELQTKREIGVAYNKTVTILNSSVAMDDLLSRSLASITSSTNSQVGIIYLYDEKEEFLKVASSYAVGDHNFKQEKFRPGMGIPGQTAQERKPILINDIPEDTSFMINYGLDECVPKSIGSFPILSQGKLLGVLVLASLKEYPDHILEFLDSILVQLAVAIINTRSFELVQKQAEMLKMQESELLEREERISAILDNTVDAIITIDAHGTVESFNQSAERIFGYTAFDVIGNNIKMLQPEPYYSEHDQYLRNYLNTGTKKIIGIGREVMGQRKDGTTFPIELAVSEVMIGEKRLFCGILRDITERKQSEEELKNASEALQLKNEELLKQSAELLQQKSELNRKNYEVERSSRAKSEFLANMSHELRTPLNSVIGFSEMLADQTFGELNTKQSKYIKNINTSGVHLLQLINDILDLSKVEAGKMVLHYEEFPIDDVLKSVISINAIHMKKKNIFSEMEIEKGLPLVNADQKMFKQIMHNLLSNAIKFTPEGGKIVVKAALLDGFILVAVIDTGIGIKPEDCKSVFVEFEQIDSSTSRKYEGTGLGLPLTRKFVELHGGEIWIESEFGKGSTFAFTIPLKTESKHLIQELSSIDKIDGKIDNPLILVVEDDPLCSELIKVYLVENGYKVALAFNGNEAIKKAKELHPLAITLDIMLPEKDGWETLSELKEMVETKNIPIIIVSVIDEKERGFNLGAIDYLLKPINRDVLLKTLERCGVGLGSTVEKKPINILIIDDEPKTVELMSLMLETEGYCVQKAYGGQEGIDLADKHQYDLVISDLMMPEVDGFDVVDNLHKQPLTKDVPIIISTAKDLTKDDLERLHGKVLSISQKGKFSKEDLLRDIKRVEKSKKAEL